MEKEFWHRKEVKDLHNVVICVVCSALTTTIITRILVIHYLKIVDSYVKSMVDLTIDFMNFIQCKYK